MGLVKKDDKAADKAGAAQKDEVEYPPVVQSLMGIDDKVKEIELEMEREVQKLRAKLYADTTPLFYERKAVLAKAGEVSADTGTPALRGFWLQALKNHPATEDHIQSHDEPVLEYVTDIRAVQLDEADHFAGFSLVFKFAKNPYFEHRELRKTLKTERPLVYNGQVNAMEITSEPITWSRGKDVTIETVSKKKPAGGKKRGAPKAEVEPRPSFFRDFFRSLKPGCQLTKDMMQSCMDSDEEEDGDGGDEFIEYIMENDLETARAIQEQLVPWAVRWYTGEARADEDDDDEDGESEMDGEDDDDDDDEDSSPPARRKGGGGRAAGGAKAKAGGAVDAQKQEECKQQ